MSFRSGESWDGAKWRRVIEPGERILWYGESRPGGGMDRDSWVLLLGLAPIGLIGGPVLALIGLNVDWPLVGRAMFLFFAVAALLLTLLVVRLIWQDARAARKPVHYALTDRRALIRAWHGLESWPITAGTVAEKRPGKPGSVVFAQETDAPDPVDPDDIPGSRDIGFFNIPDADEVLRLIRRIQTAQSEKMEIAS